MQHCVRNQQLNNQRFPLHQLPKKLKVKEYENILATHKVSITSTSEEAKSVLQTITTSTSFTVSITSTSEEAKSVFLE